MILSEFRHLFLTLLLTGFVAVPALSQEPPVPPAEPPPAPAEQPPAEQPPAPPAPPSMEAPPAMPAMPKPEDVVATVDGVEITHGEVLQRTQAMMQQMQGRIPPQQMQMMAGQFYSDAQNRAISDRLLASEAANKNISVDEAKVDEEIERARGSLPEGVTLDDALGRMGTDLAKWKVQLTEQMQIQKLVESVVADIPDASDEDVTTFYNENPDMFKTQASIGASHILIGFDAQDGPEQRAEKKAKLEDLRKQIDGGADFAALAQEHSSCPSSAKGGNLGSFGKGQMVPAFEQAAFALEPGEISGVVETNFGYHLIKLNDKTEEGTQPLDEIREQLGNYLNGQKKQEALRAHIDGLREKAVITFPQATDTP